MKSAAVWEPRSVAVARAPGSGSTELCFSAPNWSVNIVSVLLVHPSAFLLVFLNALCGAVWTAIKIINIMGHFLDAIKYVRSWLGCRDSQCDPPPGSTTTIQMTAPTQPQQLPQPPIRPPPTAPPAIDYVGVGAFNQLLNDSYVLLPTTPAHRVNLFEDCEHCKDLHKTKRKICRDCRSRMLKKLC